MRIIVIGGVAGGASFAARLRRLSEEDEIVIYEKSSDVSYANCGIPYYIGGVIPSFNNLKVVSKQTFKDRFNIEVRTSSEITEIDKDKKTVKVHNLITGETYLDHYDVLLLSPGAKPIKLNIPGMDLPEIFTLRNLEDTKKLKNYLNTHKVRKAAVIGAGFVGIETAENLKHLGLEVAIFQKLPQILANFDEDMVTLLEMELIHNGIDLRLNQDVTGFEKGQQIKVVTKDTKEDFDIVIFAIGVTHDTSLFPFLEKDKRGAILVDENFKTSVDGIYAVGDAISILNRVTDEKQSIFLAGPANKEGRNAASLLKGIDDKYVGSNGSSVIKVFGLAAASTGINEREAKRRNLPIETLRLEPMNHASYYPGATPIFLKLVYNKETGEIYGAQAIGHDGVEKRIDVISTAMMCHMKAWDLKNLDLCYAPPFSSAKDPVNMAGFMAQDIKDGLCKQFYPEDVDNLPRDGSLNLIDVRTAMEYNQGHIPGFINIPLDGIRNHLKEIDKTKPFYIHCQGGLRSYVALRILANNGCDVKHLSGGYLFYLFHKSKLH